MLLILFFFHFRGIDYVGSLFTWSKMSEGYAHVKERLDRFQCTMDRFEIYHLCKVGNIVTSVSDHNCLLLNTEGLGDQVHMRTRPFRFKSMWIGARGCEETIAAV